MNRKLFAVLFAVGLLFAFAGTSMAGESYLNLDSNAASDDWASDVTFNDGAYADGSSMGYSENHGYASGYYDWNTGYAGTKSETNAFADADDYGLTSTAKAGAKTESRGLAGGVSYGWDSDTNSSYGHVEGDVYQDNHAKELGYASGTGAWGMNQSGASYSGDEYDADHSCCGTKYSGIRLSGEARTSGNTFVSVDPSGSYQSAHAYTGNTGYADVKSADCELTNVYGFGDIGAGANARNYNASSSAGGNAGFHYGGSSYGTGMADINAQAHVGDSYSSSHVTGSSSTYSY